MKKPQRRLQRSDTLWLATACLIVLLQFWWLPGNRGTSADSFSTSIEGSRGLFQTLSALSEQNLLPPVRRETERLIPDRPCTLLLLGPERYPNEQELVLLRQFVSSGGCLLFAANWGNPDYHAGSLQFRTSSGRSEVESTLVPPTPPVMPLPAGDEAEVETKAEADVDTEDGEVESLPESDVAASPSTPATIDNDELLPESPGLLPTTDPTQPLDDFDTDIESWSASSDSPLVEGSLSWRSTASLYDYPRSADILVRTAYGDTQVASWPVGRGALVVSASAYPFSNRSMLFDRQAEFAVRLVEFGVEKTRPLNDAHEIVVCEYLNGAGTYTGPELLISPALRIGTLQMILVGVLLAWSGFHRFGPATESRTSQRRSLAESAMAVGNLQYQTHDGAASVRSYLDWLRSEARRRFGHDHVLDDIPALARHTGLSEDGLADAISTACQRAETLRLSPPDAAASIRNLAFIHHRLSGRGMDDDIQSPF